MVTLWCGRVMVGLLRVWLLVYPGHFSSIVRFSGLYPAVPVVSLIVTSAVAISAYASPVASTNGQLPVQYGGGDSGVAPFSRLRKYEPAEGRRPIPRESEGPLGYEFPPRHGSEGLW